MNALNLNQQEQEVLMQILKRSLTDLDHEIRHTDSSEYKRMLRERQIVLIGIVNKFPAMVEHAAAL